MPQTKQKLIRHYALDRCLKNHNVLNIEKTGKMHDLYNRNIFNYG